MDGFMTCFRLSGCKRKPKRNAKAVLGMLIPFSAEPSIAESRVQTFGQRLSGE